MYIYVTQPSAFLPCSSNATQRFVVCRVTVTCFNVKNRFAKSILPSRLQQQSKDAVKGFSHNGKQSTVNVSTISLQTGTLQSTKSILDL